MKAVALHQVTAGYRFDDVIHVPDTAWGCTVLDHAPDEIAERLQHHRLGRVTVVWAHKAHMDRSTAWASVPGRAELPTDESLPWRVRNPWRRCHTKNYWAYYRER